MHQSKYDFATVVYTYTTYESEFQTRIALSAKIQYVEEGDISLSCKYIRCYALLIMAPAEYLVHVMYAKKSASVQTLKAAK